jgi:predicted DNA-binding transcriptional regulator AlpA
MTNFTTLDEYPTTLRAADISKIFGISMQSAYSLMHTRDFPSIQIGRSWVVNKDHLMVWMESKAAPKTRWLSGSPWLSHAV